MIRLLSNRMLSTESSTLLVSTTERYAKCDFIVNRYAYCEPLAEILDFQYHMLVYIADKYNVVLSALLVGFIDTVQTCVYLCMMFDA